MTSWGEVWGEHQGNVGFIEGSNNQNPWTEEMLGADVAYCVAAATIIAHHHGVTWWNDAQWGDKGYAYCPYAVSGAQRHGNWLDDHASIGHPADLLPGDIVFYDWDFNGVADHAETVVVVYDDNTFDTVGYNTGSPEGCHFPIRRDRTYLLGRMRMEGVFYSTPPAPAPTPTPGGPVAEGYPFNTTSAHIADWVDLDGHGWLLDANGAVYASPGSPGLRGVNGEGYFAGRQAAKLHVRSEGGAYVDTVQATSGELYRPDGGAPFTTH